MSTVKKLMLCQLCLLLPFLIRGSSISAASQPIAHGGCQDRCGDVQIPYPFGIGKGCYMSEWYEIVCSKAFNRSVTFLRKIKREVMSISLKNDDYNKSTIRVKAGPIYSSGCGSSRGRIPSTLNVTGSPFYLSDNSLTAVGCNTKVSWLGMKMYDFGCQSTCDATNFTEREREGCCGYKCCQVGMEPAKVFSAKLEKQNRNKRQNGCMSAFLTDDTWTPLNTSKTKVLGKEYMPVTLRWYYNGSVSNMQPSDSIKCINDTDTVDDGITSYYCWCQQGYRGNPYLPNGCKDIDECQESVAKGQKMCGNNVCKNILGSYTCEVKKVWPLILGVSLGVGLLFVAAGIWWLYRFIKRQKIMRRKKSFFKRNGGLLLQKQLYSADGKVEKTKIFSSKELERATDKFSQNRILGQGGQGTVYKGMLVDGTIVAIKKSKLIDKENLKEFINEVVILSQTNHRNVVKLLGCCLETEVPMLVYEFVPNGNLFQHLHAQSDEFPMTWNFRLRIATEIAGALYYLHSAAAIPIYHRDIKSTNILLDEKYKAKVSDFGTSRSVTIDQTHLTTGISGTFGYIDPEYFLSSQFTDKSDVYSFGIVLVELLTGEKPVCTQRSEEVKALSAYFILSMEENELNEILDARIIEESNIDEVVAVANLARKCLSSKGKRRPTMKEVALELERIQSRQKVSEVHLQNEEEIAEEFVLDLEDFCDLSIASDPISVVSSLADIESSPPCKTW